MTTKITKARIWARRVIFRKTLLLLQFTGTAILILGIRVFHVKSFEFFIACVFGPIAISMIITYLRMRMNDDGDLIRKWGLKKRSRYTKAKKEYLDAVENAKSTYTIISSMPEKTKSGEFKLTFAENIHPKATPIVKLNGLQMTLQSFENNSAIYYCRTIKNYANILFSIGQIGWDMDNPYLMNLLSDHIRWQAAGHTSECNIWLNGNAFKYPNADVSYDFKIKINKETFGPFKGFYDEEENVIQIATGHINANCKQNKCILIPTWNNELSVAMPCPESLSVNHERKYDKLFSGKTQTA